MGLFFRKTYKVGPININLSKSGIGWSAGVKGLRYGKNAKGKNYVSAGRRGVYYRRQWSDEPRPCDSDEPRDSSGEYLPIIILGVISLLAVGGLVLAFFAILLVPILFVIGAVVLIRALTSSKGSKPSASWHYALDDECLQTYNEIVACFAAALSGKPFYLLPGDDASNVTPRRGEYFGPAKLPRVQVNRPVPAVIAPGIHVYLLPDGILVLPSAKAWRIPYDMLVVRAGTLELLDDSSPEDAPCPRPAKPRECQSGPLNDKLCLRQCQYGLLEFEYSAEVLVKLAIPRIDAVDDFCKKWSQLCARFRCNPFLIERMKPTESHS